MKIGSQISKALKLINIHKYEWRGEGDVIGHVDCCDQGSHGKSFRSAHTIYE